MPVLADEDGVLIAGHLRVAVAAKLKLTSIPVSSPAAGARRRRMAIAWRQ